MIIEAVDVNNEYVISNAELNDNYYQLRTYLYKLLLYSFIHKLIEAEQQQQLHNDEKNKKCSLIAIETQKRCFRRLFITVFLSGLR